MSETLSSPPPEYEQPQLFNPEDEGGAFGTAESGNAEAEKGQPGVSVEDASRRMVGALESYGENIPEGESKDALQATPEEIGREKVGALGRRAARRLAKAGYVAIGAGVKAADALRSKKEDIKDTFTAAKNDIAAAGMEAPENISQMRTDFAESQANRVQGEADNKQEKAVDKAHTEALLEYDRRESHERAETAWNENDPGSLALESIRMWWLDKRIARRSPKTEKSDEKWHARQEKADKRQEKYEIQNAKNDEVIEKRRQTKEKAKAARQRKAERRANRKQRKEARS